MDKIIELENCVVYIITKERKCLPFVDVSCNILDTIDIHQISSYNNPEPIVDKNGVKWIAGKKKIGDNDSSYTWVYIPETEKPMNSKNRKSKFFVRCAAFGFLLFIALFCFNMSLIGLGYVLSRSENIFFTNISTIIYIVGFVISILYTIYTGYDIIEELEENIK